jgi:hypothetical protein
MMTRIRLAEEGSAFSTRARGARLLADIEERALASAGESIVLDFEGVNHVSYSFADAFVGKLVQHARDTGGTLPAIENATPGVLEIIDLNLNSRRLPLVTKPLASSCT